MTTYHSPNMSARNIGARTDSGGSAATDLSAEEDRISALFMGQGKLTATAFVPAAGGGGTMDVVIGSGGAKADYYSVAGQDTGQGNYLVRLDDASDTIALDAADGSLPRKDEIYLTVRDNAYDASGFALPQLVYQPGVADATPAAPGPPSSVDAYVLIATMEIPAAAPNITTVTITDERIESTFGMRDASVAGDLTVTGNLAVAGTVDGADIAAHAHTGADGTATVDATDLTNLKTAVDAAAVDADTVDGVEAAGFTLIAHDGAGGAAHADAVASGAAGFISGADQARLDAMEDAATADQTLTGGNNITVSGAPDYTIDHDNTGGAASINTATATVIDQLTFDAHGHCSLATTRTLTASDIGASATSHNHDGDYYTFEGTGPAINISTSSASGGDNGDLWFKY